MQKPPPKVGAFFSPSSGPSVSLLPAICIHKEQKECNPPHLLGL